MAKKRSASGGRGGRTAAKKNPPARKARGSTKGAGPSNAGSKTARDVVVRMYKQGLGDCFLLTFPPAADTRPVRVLIDCGVFQHTPREAEKMRAVVHDILHETGGKIDLLIVTHEHWDHVAGFSHAEDLFTTGQITIGRVWLSWAENLNDSLARTIHDDLARKKKTVQAALRLVAERGLQAKLKAAGDDVSSRRMDDDIETSKSILGFLGMAGDGPEFAAAKKARPPGVSGMTLGQTMDWLRSLVKPGDFCLPGERRLLPGVSGVNLYVLGPPRDESLIIRMDAAGEAGYAFRVAGVSLAGAVEGTGSDPDQAGMASGPFEARYRLTPEQAACMPFFGEFYGFPGDDVSDDPEAWRRIDDEWLVDGVSQLALQIDKKTNNSSFALAFELPDGRTLIFPGDAQFGNWVSWDDLKFVDPAGKEVAVTTRQLLNRAVLYKVGHHGSHNATRPASLHAMTSGALVAMIPTDEQFALLQNKKGTWRMPAQELNDDLKLFTAGRILRADRGQNDLDDRGKQRSSDRSWSEFTARVRFSPAPLLPDLDPAEFPLYVEYRIPYE